MEYLHPLLFILAIFSSNPYASDVPSILRIGLLSSLTDNPWNFHLDSFSSFSDAKDQTRQLRAVIMMAIDEVNANAYILPDTQLQLSYNGNGLLDDGEELLEAEYLTHGSFNDTGADVLLGPFSSITTEAVSTALKEHQMYSFSPTAQSSIFSAKVDYPYTIRLIPSLVYQANAIVDLMRMRLHDW